MKEIISISIQTNKNTTVNVNIHIPTDTLKVECDQEIRVNREIESHQEVDPGYEIADLVKNWYSSEDEGRIYDNLD